jgi:monoterpene epsilon-lactone hydrolase
VSLRAELIRLGLRWLVKRKMRAVTTLEQFRQSMGGFVNWLPNPPAGTETIATDAGGVPAILITRPVSRLDCHILYLHGGGYVAGSPALYRDFTWRVANVTRARVLCIDYRLAPEHPFPAALEDAVAAYRWLISDGATPQRIAIMGDSAGGGLVFATLLKLRDEGVTLPAAAVALSPFTDLALTGDSLRENAESDPFLLADGTRQLADYYLAGADPRTPYASPLYGDPSGLPPTLIHVGSDEILRDDGVRMAERMRAAGCMAEIEVWPRMPHVFHLFWRVMPEAQQGVKRIGRFVRSRFQLDVAAP